MLFVQGMHILLLDSISLLTEINNEDYVVPISVAKNSRFLKLIEQSPLGHCDEYDRVIQHTEAVTQEEYFT